MDDLLSKLSIAHRDRPQFTGISPELRSERKADSGGFGTVLKESWNKTEVFTEKYQVSPSLQSERKIGSGGFGSLVKESLNTTEIFTEISPSELQLEREIGSGGFGTVFKGSWNKTKVAIKVFKLEGSVKPRQAAIRKEAETWAKLRHPHILLFLGADTKGEVPFIVMPYLENGNARDFIERHSECNRNKILYDVTLALVYLHGRNVVHGDIKGFNVLIDGARNAVLCDFGIALIKEDVLSTSLNLRETSISGTPSFMAPERLKGGSLRKPCDVYAFGMLIYEVHTNANPLNLHVGYSEFTKLVAIEGYRPERPGRDEAPQMTDDIWCLAERCWVGTASSRPSINDVCDLIAPSVELYDNRPSNPSSEGTRSARSSIDNISDSIPPSVNSDGNYPVPLDGGPSTHVPTPPPSAYDRLRAGATFRETFLIRTSSGRLKYLTALAMTHDGETIASSGAQGGDVTIQTWDSTSGALRTTLRGHTDDVTRLSFFKNGWLVSGSLDTTVRVWDLTGSATAILRHNYRIYCISLSTDNKTIATGVADRFVRLWDATTGRLMHTLEAPGCSLIQSISISSDTSSLVALGCGTKDSNPLKYPWVAIRWKQRLDGQWVVDVSRECHSDFSSHNIASASSSDLRFALGKVGHFVIYDFHGNETHIDGGRGVMFSPDGSWLVGYADSGWVAGGYIFKIWDAASGKILSEPLHIEPPVFISHDGTTIVGASGTMLRVLVLTDS